MRYLLVDRIDELRKFGYATGTKCITRTEDCFEHHFPGQPVYPGAMLIESLAQLGGALLEISLRDERDPCPRCVLSKVTARFREFARPGDVLSLRTEIRSRRDESALVQGSIRRQEVRIAEAELLFILLEIPHPLLQVSRDDYLDQLTRDTRFVE